MNVELRELKDIIIGVLNGSSLPIETKRLVLSEILFIVEKAADNEIRAELEKKNAENIHED